MTSVRAKFDLVQIALVALLTLAFTGISIAQVSQTDIYFAKQIWTGQGDPIPDAAMIVVDGKITEVGPRAEVSVPPTAFPHELGNQIIIPGLIAAHSNLSGSQGEERTITPEISAIDGFDFFADRSSLLESGITTVQVSPGENRLMPGVGGVVQLYGEDLIDRVLSDQESLRIVLSTSSRNPPRIYEPPVGPVSQDRPLTTTRPQLASLPASLAGLRQIFKNARSNETFVSSARDEVVESVSALIRSDTPLRITATTAPEIRGAVNLAKEFDVSIILVDCVGLEPFKNVFEDWKPQVKGVVLAGLTPGTIDNPSDEQLENESQPWDFARNLLDAKIPVAIRTRADADLEQLMFVAGQFMQANVSATELLAMVTSAPASMMGVEKQVGSLSKGSRADFVVLNDQPFKLHARVQATFVSGTPVFEREREPTTTVVRGGRVYLGDGHFFDNASVVVKGTTVRGLGTSVSAPIDADVRNFDGAVIVPGFVDMGSGLGLGGPLRGNLTLQTKLGEQLYADDPAIDFARKHGITTVLMGGPNSSQPGPVVAFKLGDDARVISDPIAIRFKLDGDTASGIASNERLLKAGKAYADSWIKYKKDLAEYEVKAKALAAKTAAADAKKAAEKKTEAKEKPAESKTETGDKKEADKKEVGDKKRPETKKPLPDPITGSWEGTIDVERIPEQLRKFTFELVLEGSTVTGTVSLMRNDAEIEGGTYDRETKTLTIPISRRGTSIPISGTIDNSGNFAGNMNMGRMGEVPFTASRTVDKSKKPEPEPKPPEKKDNPDDKKDKPDSDKDKPAGDKPADEKDKKETDEKKKTDEQKPETKPAEKPAETKPEPKKEELKPPTKPKVSEALEPYRALFAGKIPAFVESRDLNSMKAAAELFSKTYGVRTVLVGADDLARDPSVLNDYDVSVCTGPGFSVKIDKQPATNLPQLLANERLKFGFQSLGTTGTGRLPGAIQFAVSQGLSATDALQGLTANPASMLAGNVNFGSLAAGKDADLVVLSGPPFEFSTKVLAVMIDGVWVYEREEQK